MGSVKLGQLVAEPRVVAGTEAGAWDCLASGTLPLPEGHAVFSAAARASRPGYSPKSVSLTARVGLLNLGDSPGEGGFLLLLHPGGAAERPAHWGTWVVWSLARPSVDLFLGVEDVFHRLTYRIYPDTPVSEVQHLMMRRGISFVPVVGAEHEMLGVIGVHEVLAHTLPGGHGPAERSRAVARDIMRRSVLCVSEQESLAEASRAIIGRDVAQLPVVREGKLVGFLDRETVLRAFADTLVAASPATG